MTNAEIRKLKAEGQRLEPVVYVGKSGLTAAVLQSVEQALRARELIKIRFDHDRDERDVLAGKVAEVTGATLIMYASRQGSGVLPAETTGNQRLNYSPITAQVLQKRWP